MSRRDQPPTLAMAESIAAQGLAFLAAEPARLVAFPIAHRPDARGGSRPDRRTRPAGGGAGAPGGRRVAAARVCGQRLRLRLKPSPRRWLCCSRRRRVILAHGQRRNMPNTQLDAPCVSASTSAAARSQAWRSTPTGAGGGGATHPGPARRLHGHAPRHRRHRSPGSSRRPAGKAASASACRDRSRPAAWCRTPIPRGSTVAPSLATSRPTLAALCASPTTPTALPCRRPSTGRGRGAVGVRRDPRHRLRRRAGVRRPADRRAARHRRRMGSQPAAVGGARGASRSSVLVRAQRLHGGVGVGSWHWRPTMRASPVRC